MRTHTLLVVSALPALAFMPLDSTAFVGTGTSQRIIIRNQHFVICNSEQTPSNIGTILQGKQSNGDGNSSENMDTAERNIFFSTLSTDRDRAPNQGTFFYNDEVISHLYGYVYLVGLFAAQDSLFLGTFLLLSSASAWATQESILPCNPRIPGLTVGLTLSLTLTLRYGLGFEPDLHALLPDYQGPADSALLFEVAISALNLLWGFFGTWRTKEQVNGATYGF